MKQKTQFHRIPIYDLRLWIGVSDDPLALRNSFNWAFGNDHYPEGCPGLCCYHRSKFAVLFSAFDLSHQLIAHEAFHVTHRMMEYIGGNFSFREHEPYTYLNGYITELIYIDLEKWKYAVRKKSPRVHALYVKA